MALPAELIVAKTTLSGALFRADPRPCSRDDIESLLALLDLTIAECSPPNVQRCKQWALSNLVSSSARVAPFCKYLVALAGSFGGEKDAAAAPAALGSKRPRIPSAKRRRLHVLYILSDILYHVKHRNRDDAFAQKVEPFLPPLVRSAASFHNCPKHIRKLHDLVGLWEENGYFSPSFTQQLHTAIDEGPSSGAEARNGDEVDNSTNSIAQAAKNAPWVMPAMHGDPSTPWYDLPAGNWLPVLEPNSTRPMNPSMIKPLVLARGPADKALVEAVKSLLSDVDRLYSKEANFDEPSPTIGRLGERVEIDEITGEIIGGDTYYGWSRAFCEKMKRRRRERSGRSDRSGDEGSRGRARFSRSDSRSESRSRSWRRARSGTSSRSPSRPSYKRRRLSASPRDNGRRRSRSRTPINRSRSRSYRTSRSRSRSPPRRPSRSRSRGRGYRRAGDDQGDKYQTRSPSYSPARSRSRSWDRSRSPPSRSVGVPQPPGNGFRPPPPGNWNQQQPPQPPPSMPYPAPPPAIPPQPGFGFGFPVPPPPPPSYQGPWPPVPPPLPPPPAAGTHPLNFIAPGGHAVPPPPFPGAWPPPPPPPAPADPRSEFQQQGGRGGGGYQAGSYGRGGWR